MYKYLFKMSLWLLLLVAASTAPGVAQPNVSIAKVSATDLGGQERCVEAPADVVAASGNERRLACSGVHHALQLPGRCGIVPRRPLHVEMSNGFRHRLGRPTLGLFDAKRDRVHIAQYESIPRLVRDTPYAELPLRELFKSIVVHEVVHGVMHQNAKQAAMSLSAHEYPAYALQIESLPPKSARQILAVQP
jgi:hypothetical protein